MALQENSLQLHGSSSLGHDLNNLNKTFDLNKFEGHLEASGEIKTTLEPLSKLILDCTNQKNVPIKSSMMELDESLGILPDLLNDEMTFDLLKTELIFRDNDIHGEVDLEINENPASSVLSPPSYNQFNKTSLFLENGSTPLPNCENDRRFSSTPKILASSHFLAKTTNIVEHNSSPYFLEEKEEPIIAGSCCIKFETDFNLDYLKNVKPLTSTHKTIHKPLPRASLILNELNEHSDLKSKVNFQEKPEIVKINLNVTQTFSNNIESLSPYKHEDSVQDVNVLNNTFKIKQPDFTEAVDAVVSFKNSIPSAIKVDEESSKYCEKEKVKILDCTFAITENEISCNEDHKKTFLIVPVLTVETEVSPNPIYQEKMLNETRVVEMDSVEQSANATFIKKLDCTQINFENHCYSSQSVLFEPMSQILEESEIFSENDLNVTKVVKNSVPCISGKDHPESSELFKTNVAFSEKSPGSFSKGIIQNDLFEFVSNSPKVPLNSFHEDAKDNLYSHEQVNLAEIENHSNKIPLSNSLKSIEDSSFSDEIYKRTNQEFNKFQNSSLKRCSLGSKIAVKSKLSKPTRVVFPRVAAGQHAGQLPPIKSLCKPLINKRPIVSDFNCPINLNNSTDKTFSKDFNRKLSLPSSSSNNDKSKCKNNFKKPFGIPSKLVIKKHVSSYQNSRLDIKCSNGKNIAAVNCSLNLSPPDLISKTNSKMIKSADSVYGKGHQISSRLSLNEKLHIKSFKTKEFGLKANAVVTNTSEKTAIVTSSPRVIDLPRKEKLTECSNNNNLGKIPSKHSNVRNTARKFTTSSINIPNNTCDLNPVVIKQMSAPAGNSCKAPYIKPPNNEKLPISITKPKIVSLSKFQLPTKISSIRNESKSPVEKALSSGNRKSNVFPLKLCVPKGETVQFVKTQINTGQKLRDNIRENTQLDSSIDHISICRQASGKLPQLRRIPSPQYHK